MRDLRGEASLPLGERAAHLAAFETDLLAWAASSSRAANAPHATAGDPVVTGTARWRDLLAAHGLEGGRGEAQALLEALVADAAARWSARNAPLLRAGDPEACFGALSQASAIDRQALARRAGRRPLREARGPLREAFLAALRAAPASEAQRVRWALDLADRADVVLTGIDDAEPAVARDELDLVIDDLAWHLGEVETARGRGRSRLARKLRRLRAERQERELQDALEARFGTAAVARFERFILVLIVLVLGILAVESFFAPGERLAFWLMAADSAACLVFLWEFFFKLALVRGRRSWFLRHFLIDLIPSIPFSLILLHPTSADTVRAGRAARFLRLPRLARYVRLLRPGIRLIRAFGFLSRGIDRLERGYGHLLNRDILVTPTREERARARAGGQSAAPRLLRLHGAADEEWERLLRGAEPEERAALAALRLESLRAARARGALGAYGAAGRPDAEEREILAEELLVHLERVTPEELEARLGAEFVQRMARAVRLFALPPIRWFPIIRRYVPRLGGDQAPGAVVAAAARRTAAELRRQHGRLLWISDLYGTVTPAQFVDRVGTTLVKGSFRPAFRLSLFGTFFLFVELLLGLTGIAFLVHLERFLQKFLVMPLIVLGAVCFALLGLGVWMRRAAGRFSAYFQQVARAQFLSLTETVKARALERDAAILERRVLGPEALLRGGDEEGGAAARRERFCGEVRRWLAAGGEGGGEGGAEFPLDRVVLLYRDGLDGGLLTEEDTRTTGKLLGDPSLRALRALSPRFTPRDRKALDRLDLERQTSLFRGPYFWFSLISDSVEQGAARFIADYNERALPLLALARATPAEASRHAAWLDGTMQEDPLPEAAACATTRFTALHFLDDDPRRDAAVERDFGPRVLARLRQDRRRLIRRLFGTYPLHARPREERVLNLHRIYETRFARGRAFFLPWYVFATGCRLMARFVRGIGRSFREVRRPTPQAQLDRSAEADFIAAARKINRMRAPVVEASMLQRALADPEYLGVRLPGVAEAAPDGCDAAADLRFLGTRANLARDLEEAKRRAEADMARLGRLLEQGLFERCAQAAGRPAAEMGREHLRAAASIYLADLQGIRSLLSAPRVLEEAFLEAQRNPPPPAPPGFRPALRRAFRAYRSRHGVEDPRSAWRATAHDLRGARGALLAWARHGDRAAAEGERLLADLLRRPERISETLVTLRTVQTLALLDVLVYREQIYRLGGYAADGDLPGALLTL
ncbi:MAG: ion transporter [Planctomycetaceae bacterium]